MRATVDGRVVRLTAAVGNLATSAQSIMVVVPLDVWVTANFKETQLANMRLGQPLDISIAYGRSYKGHLVDIQSQRYGVQPFARRKRHWEFCEGGAARSGQGYVRSAP